MRLFCGIDYLKAKDVWEKADDAYLQHLEELGDCAPAREYKSVASVLLEFEDRPALHKAAVEYSRRAYEKDQIEPQFAATYISALRATGKMYSAVQITEQYRKKMSRTPHGRVTLKEFESLLAATFEEKIESSP